MSQYDEDFREFPFDDAVGGGGLDVEEQIRFGDLGVHGEAFHAPVGGDRGWGHEPELSPLTANEGDHAGVGSQPHECLAEAPVEFGGEVQDPVVAEWAVEAVTGTWFVKLRFGEGCTKGERVGGSAHPPDTGGGRADLGGTPTRQGRTTSLRRAPRVDDLRSMLVLVRCRRVGGSVR